MVSPDISAIRPRIPIKANFREGLEPLEYFISTYGARKGLVDTASHTSDSGYLTRRLVDVAQDVIVREEDCGTDEAVTYPLIKPGQTSVDTDLIGRCTLEDVCDPNTGEVLIPAGGYVESKQDLERLVEHGLAKVQLRALLTCKSKYGVCQKCYGREGAGAELYQDAGRIPCQNDTRVWFQGVEGRTVCGAMAGREC